MARSNQALKRWYNFIRVNFFPEVPTNVCVRWADEFEIGFGDDFWVSPKDLAASDFAHDGHHSFEIVLQPDNNPGLTVTLNTLLHEMVHVATELRDDHGPAFEKWREILGERGIFKKGAVRKGLTLF